MIIHIQKEAWSKLMLKQSVFCLSLNVFLAISVLLPVSLSDFCPYKLKLAWHKHAA